MQFDFNLAANGAQIINVRGQFVKYVKGIGQIRVRISGGGYIDLLPGQGARGLAFEQLTVEDRSGAGNIGVLLAGAFEFQDDRITGTVDVVDGGKDRTLSNSAFFLYDTASVSVAGNFPYAMAFNPAGSGKNVYVKQVLLSASIACFIGLGVMTAPAGVKGGNARPKKFGGADGVTESRRFDQVGYPYSYNLTGSNVPAGGSVLIPFTEPVLLPPGYGLIAGGNNSTQGQFITAAFELLELVQ